jgi:hypothetical protein
VVGPSGLRVGALGLRMSVKLPANAIIHPAIPLYTPANLKASNTSSSLEAYQL